VPSLSVRLGTGPTAATAIGPFPIFSMTRLSCMSCPFRRTFRVQTRTSSCSWQASPVGGGLVTVAVGVPGEVLTAGRAVESGKQLRPRPELCRSSSAISPVRGTETAAATIISPVSMATRRALMRSRSPMAANVPSTTASIPERPPRRRRCSGSVKNSSSRFWAMIASTCCRSTTRGRGRTVESSVVVSSSTTYTDSTGQLWSAPGKGSTERAGCWPVGNPANNACAKLCNPASTDPAICWAARGEVKQAKMAMA